MKRSLAAALLLFCSLAAYAETASDPGASYCSRLIPDLKFIHRQLYAASNRHTGRGASILLTGTRS